jgi:F-type H+-transporting ATPase subunit epsilon
MLKLSIVTPERPFLELNTLSVQLPGSMGDMEILPGHAPLLAELKAGLLTYRQGNEIERVMIAEGFVEVSQDRVNVLSEQARSKNEIDKEQEKSLMLELKQKIDKLEQDDVEQTRDQALLARCIARLSLFE